MKVFLKGALAASALLLFSCSSDSGSGSSGNCDASDITFFQPGKYLKYHVTQFGFDAGSMKLSFGDCNGHGFATTMEFRDAANNVTGTVPNTFWQDGQFLVGDANNDNVDLHKIFKKNAALNDTWTETDADGAILTHTVVDIDSLITVPAGSFHCKVYHYEKSDIINDSYIFWNDDVGQVMEDAGFMKYELTEHN